MYDYIQYAYGNRWRYNGKPKANTIAVPISQDQLRSELRNTTETKPDAYKSINSSQIKIITGKNPNGK